MVMITLSLARMTQNVSFLKSSPYFLGLDTDKLEILSRLIAERSVKKSEIVCLAGEPANMLYFVVSGVIKLFNTSFEGKEQILNLVRPGQSFSDIAVFDGGVHPMSAQAITESVLYGIERNDLESLMSELPQFARNVVKVIASLTRCYISLVEELSFKHVDSRLAKILLDYGGDMATHCLPQLTHHDIAAMTGTAREVIGKTLRDFARKGIISLDGRRIIITDFESLRDVAASRERESYNDVLFWGQKPDISNSSSKTDSKAVIGGTRSMEYKNASA
jgi:CRP-like cAMP-binding protein